MADSRRGVPEEWLPIFAAANVRGTYRGLAEAAERDTSLVIRVVRGEEVQDDAIVDVAHALKVSPAKIRRLRREPAREPFELPSRADRLSRKQRDAVLAVVSAMLDADSANDTEVWDATRDADAALGRLRGRLDSDSQAGKAVNG